MRIYLQYKRVAIAVALLALLAACGPEEGRQRGAGLGADIGNHHQDVPGSKVFNDNTP